MYKRQQLVDEDSAIVSIYYGEDTKEEDANALGEKIGCLLYTSNTALWPQFINAY